MFLYSSNSLYFKACKLNLQTNEETIIYSVYAGL